jgi:toxin HigB-1
VIRTFKNQGTEDVYNGVDSKAARKVCPPDLVDVARRKLDGIEAAVQLQDLAAPGNRLKKLKEDRKGQYSIRINDQYRICFVWEQRWADDVEITDYH